MSTITLIAGPQGTGKTRIVTAIASKNQNHLNYEYLFNNNTQALTVECESEEKIVIDDVWHDHDLLVEIIFYCRSINKDLILITNDPVFLYNGLDIDQAFEIKLLEINKS